MVDNKCHHGERGTAKTQLSQILQQVEAGELINARPKGLKPLEPCVIGSASATISTCLSMGCSMAAINQVRLDTHLPGYGITERSAQRPDQSGLALGDSDQGQSRTIER